ncbi:hypothetical protein [Roseofilum casamattae]|uniref:Uncharacterized protein n=1 Tax=Roseofilum casamattae BLCC-M143 TaxID=3022442 RepID=A0ABT7C1H7_9CYAN|nr:hypothetical protein [Roseofilum casamattae]MDJ1185289.1 hypothetical protein [Roseofilum casamattae BLCC-M143]
MRQLLEYILQNKEWLFSGLGLATLSAIFWLFQQSIISFRSAKKGNIKQGYSGDIRIVGPRASGKTVYLAALADWHNLGNESPVNSVEAINQAARRLIDYSRDILANGRQLGPTHAFDPHNIPHYELYIELIFNSYFWPVHSIFRRRIKFSVSFQDYSGEIFHEMARKNETNNYVINNFLDVCALSSKFMIIIDPLIIDDENDLEYALAIKNYFQELENRFIRGDRSLSESRAAVVLSKCDQLEVWKHRKNIMAFFKNKFPRSYKVLQQINAKEQCSIAYFSCSAFGMIGKPPQPNAISLRGGYAFVLKDSSSWQPFGLVAPIYWLCTGRRIRDF